ncbi:MAG: FKBP-type peptidyl-prolyl cis-trans isomerase N-terminal domain-containing protein [Planctomycetota bacterium]
MKRLRIIVGGIVIGAGLLASASGSADPAQNPAQAEHDMDEVSYGVGFYLGEEIREGLKRDGIEADLDYVVKGFFDGLKDMPPMLPRERLEVILSAVHEEMQARMVKRLLAEDPEFKKLHDENLARSRAYHEAHGNDEGVVTLPNGIQYKVLSPGTGRSPKPTDVIIVDYRVTLIDGTEIDQGTSAEVLVNSVVEGGIQILQMMKVGARWEVAVPPEFAHGPGGRFPDVGPNETILAEVELLGIK